MTPRRRRHPGLLPACGFSLAAICAFGPPASAQTPSDRRGAATYLEAIAKLGDSQPSIANEAMAPGSLSGGARQALLDANRDALILFERAAAAERPGPAPSRELGDLLSSTELRGALDRLPDLATIQAREDLATGRWEEAAHPLSAILGLGQHLGTVPTTMAWDVQMIVLEKACDLVVESFRHGLPTAPFRDAMIRACRCVRPDYLLRLDTERRDVERLLERWRRSDAEQLLLEIGGEEALEARAKGKSIPPRLVFALHPLPEDVTEDRLWATISSPEFKKTVLAAIPDPAAVFDEARGAWALPYAGAMERLQAIDQRTHGTQLFPFPYFQRRRGEERNAKAYLAACIVLLAMADHAERQREMPHDLAALQTHAGWKTPCDAAAGISPRYQHRENHVTLDAHLSKTPQATFVLRGNGPATWVAGSVVLATGCLGLGMLAWLLRPRENPVLLREWRAKRWFLRGTGILAMASAALVAISWTTDASGRGSWATVLLVIPAILSALFLLPALAALSTAEERDRGTFESLILAGRPLGPLLAGKLALRLLPGAVFPLAVVLWWGPRLWIIAANAGYPLSSMIWLRYMLMAWLVAVLFFGSIGVSLRWGATRSTLVGGILAGVLGSLFVLVLALGVPWIGGILAGIGRDREIAETWAIAIGLLELPLGLWFALSSARRLALDLERVWARE